MFKIIDKLISLVIAKKLIKLAGMMLGNVFLQQTTES